MQQFQEYRENAKKHLQIADHMLSVTYPLIKDIKLLIAIMDNISQAYDYAMSSALHYCRLFKTIPPFTETFEGKFDMFRKIALSNEIDNLYLKDIRDLKEMIEEHKKSPIEFVRKERFVICSDGYSMKTIGAEDIQNYINKAKVFIQLIDRLTSKNEGIFR